MRKRTLLRGALAATVAGVLMSTVQSSQADDPEWYPGLPDLSFGNWSNASQGGLSYAKRAKQWFRSPMGMTTAEAFYGQNPQKPGDQFVRAEGYFVSPKGAPANYGYLEPMTVRSVGFGLMPVEATVQISQRMADGYPIPVKVLLQANYTRIPHPDGGAARVDIHYPSTVITDSFNVRILSARVDGVDMGLNGECRTVEPAPVTLRSPDYKREDIGNNPEREWYATHDPSTYFNPFWGGELTGTLTIPPFTGCTTAAGDDLSDLLTLSASGPDNPVSARVGWPCPYQVDGANAPAPPGVSNPRLGGGHGATDGLDPGYCPGPKPFDYPERGDD